MTIASELRRLKEDILRSNPQAFTVQEPEQNNDEELHKAVIDEQKKRRKRYYYYASAGVSGGAGVGFPYTLAFTF